LWSLSIAVCPQHINHEEDVLVCLDRQIIDLPYFFGDPNAEQVELLNIVFEIALTRGKLFLFKRVTEESLGYL
jgi:hypothetical protein